MLHCLKDKSVAVCLLHLGVGKGNNCETATNSVSTNPPPLFPKQLGMSEYIQEHSILYREFLAWISRVDCQPRLSSLTSFSVMKFMTKSIGLLFIVKVSYEETGLS